MFFVNPGGGKPFHEGAYLLGFRERLDGRAVVPFDMDGDGLTDLALRTLQGIRIYRNVMPTENNFIQFELKVPAGKSALGARVRVQTEGGTTVGQLHIDGSFQSQVLPRLHFGLGEHQKVKSVNVQWPWGEQTTYSALDGNRRYRLNLSGDVTMIPISKWARLVQPIPAKPISGQALVNDLDGKQIPLTVAGTATIVNLWAPWCKACKTEIPHLKALAQDGGDGPAVIGLAIGQDTVAKYRQFIDENAMDYAQRIAPKTLVEQLYPTGEIRLPTTLVFDTKGKLIRRFNRAVTQQELGQVAKQLDVKITAEDLTWRAEIGTQDGDDTAAYLDLKQAAAQAPDSAILLTKVAYKADHIGRSDEALAYARKATQAEPQSEIAWQALRRLLIKWKGRERAAEQLGLAPKTALILLLRSELALEMNQKELALQLAQEAQGLSPSEQRIKQHMRWLTDPTMRRLPIKKTTNP